MKTLSIHIFLTLELLIARAFTSYPILKRNRVQYQNLFAFNGDMNRRPPPVLSPDLIYPAKVVLNGLKDASPCKAVYAVHSKDFKRGSATVDQWSKVVYVGRVDDFYEALSAQQARFGDDLVAHIRAFSFTAGTPESEINAKLQKWKNIATESGAILSTEMWPTSGATNYQSQQTVNDFLFDEDDVDDYDDDEDDWEDEIIKTEAAKFSVTANDEVSFSSPFSNGNSVGEAENSSPTKVTRKTELLEFSQENVDIVLDEIRPYLISDGGNVSVKKVEPGHPNKVFLQLEGACGSCPSSTVTMKMGIERVLNENFKGVEVVQVESETLQGEQLSIVSIQKEVDRLKPAITALGGAVDVLEVTDLGVVTLKYRGPNKIQHGLELAIRDIPGVKHIIFTSN